MDIPVGTLLKEWQSYVTTISRNLMELSEQTDVKIIKIKIKDSVNGYTGLTKKMAEKACRGLDTLWRYYALLSGVVDKANDLYGKNSFLHNTEVDVRNVLENAFITLESEHIDISSRDLLSPESNDTKVRPRELLKYMQDSFESTRDAFSEISHSAESVQKRTISMQDEVKNLKITAENLGIKDVPLFDMEKISKLMSDPLQGLKELDTVECGMEKYRDEVRGAERDYKDTVSALSRSRNTLSEIEDISGKSIDVTVQSKKVFDSSYVPRPVISPDVLDSLKDWLSVLENKLKEGFLSAAKIGAQRLEMECLMKLEAEKESYQINSRDYNDLQDMKGQFKALLVKFNSLKLKGIVFDNSIDLLVNSIQSSLYGEKVNLESCKELIGKFYVSLKS